MALLVATSLVASPGVAADTQVYTGPTGFQIKVHGQVLVWPEYTDSTRKSVVLVAVGPGTVGGRIPSFPPQDPRFGSEREFGFDVGSDRTGTPVAVASRCGPTESHSVDCDIYSFDLMTGRHTRLPVSSRRCHELNPTIHDGTVAFTREGVLRCAREGTYLKRPGKRLRRVSRRRAEEADLGPRHIALLFQSFFDRREGGDRTRISIRTLGGREVASDTADTQDDPVEAGEYIIDPILDGGFAYWVTLGFGESEGPIRITRSRLRPRTLSFADGARYGANITFHGGSLYYARQPDGGPGGIFIADDPPPIFAPPRR